MELIKTDGVVLKRTNVGDNDVILTVFTAEYGVLKASARGAKSLKSRLAAGTALFTYGEFVFGTGKSMHYVRSCEPKESFYNLATNIERLAFATYIADLTGYAVKEEKVDQRLFSLLLNTFYLLANSQRELRLVKCVYELKLLQYMGFAPELSGCVRCGDVSEIDFLSPQAGGLLCTSCRRAEDHARPLSEPCLIALRFILYSEDKKAFAFQASRMVTDELEDHMEAFIRSYMDRDFYALTYLNMILGKNDRK